MEFWQLNNTEQASFNHLLDALKYGAPPHGGIAIGKEGPTTYLCTISYVAAGFDRLMAILCNAKSLRDVIAFPKTAGGVDPLLKSPSPVADEVLTQYGLGSISR